MDTPPPHDPTGRITGWTVVYLLNLIVPGFLGFIVCKDGGLLGMLLGIAAFYGIVTWGVIRWRRFGRWATLGGVAIALTQFWPVLQMSAGIFALGVWNTGTGTGVGKNNLGTGALAEVGGFAVTILTGQPLFFGALLIGAILDKIGRVISNEPDAPETEPEP